VAKKNAVNHPTMLHEKPVSPEQLNRAANAHHEASLAAAPVEHELDHGSGLRALDAAYESHPERGGSKTPTCIEAGTTDDGTEFKDNPAHGREYAGQLPKEHARNYWQKPSSEDSAGHGGKKLSTPDGSKSLHRGWSGPGYSQDEGHSH
jgi:hypothetical protein